MMNNKLTVIAAVNDKAVLSSTLLRSPLVVKAGEELLTEPGHVSASKAYNAGISRAKGDILVFAHQDVYLPARWLSDFRAAMLALSVVDPNWAVLGAFGVDCRGRHVGRTWSSGLNSELGGPFRNPVAVQSLDELLIVLRADVGLRFDENLPGFHFYGTDIVQMAITMGLGAYVIHAPVVHNSNPDRGLGADYWEAYDYMVRKWYARLPIVTCVVPLTRSPWPRIRYRCRWLKRRLVGAKPTGGRQPDPAAIAQRLGYESESPLVPYGEPTL